MDDTLKLTESYWEVLKSLNDEVKLRLATRLTASVIASKSNTVDKTEEMLNKHLGTWKDDRTTEKSKEESKMARPIKETPVLSGEDTARFEEAIRKVKPLSKERREQIRKESEAFRRKVIIKI